MVFVHMGECISNMTLRTPRSQSCHICLVHTGAHEPPKAAKERRTQHVCPTGSSSPSHVPNFYPIRQEAIM